MSMIWQYKLVADGYGNRPMYLEKYFTFGFIFANSACSTRRHFVEMM